MPNGRSKCPECGLPIGGQSHNLVDTSTRIAVTGRTTWNTGGEAARHGMNADVAVLGQSDAPTGYSDPADDKTEMGEQFRELVPLGYRMLRCTSPHFERVCLFVCLFVCGCALVSLVCVLPATWCMAASPWHSRATSVAPALRRLPPSFLAVPWRKWWLA